MSVVRTSDSVQMNTVSSFIKWASDHSFLMQGHASRQQMWLKLDPRATQQCRMQSDSRIRPCWWNQMKWIKGNILDYENYCFHLGFPFAMKMFTVKLV